jgi:hypothetical protein
MGIAYNTSIVRNGLVLHLDAANVKSYPGTGTTWSDLSGNGNDGTLVNGVGFDSDNKGAMIFDGVNDYFRINSLGSITTRFSISAFIFPQITSGGSDRDRFGGTVFSQDASSGNRYPLWFRLKGTEMSYSIWDSDVDGNTTSGANIELNKWHYIAIVAEKNGILEIYHNKNLIVNDICKNQGTWDGNFYIGDLRAGRNILFGGSVSNTVLYNKLLNNIEIQQNFEAHRGRYGI